MLSIETKQDKIKNSNIVKKIWFGPQSLVTVKHAVQIFQNFVAFSELNSATFTMWHQEILRILFILGMPQFVRFVIVGTFQYYNPATFTT